MAANTDEVNTYVQHYEAQSGGNIPVFSGGNIPVFKGGSVQYGAGIGDFFRGLFRTLFPVALKTVGAFVGNAAEAHAKGASIKDAAKGALRPALNTAISGAVQAFGNQTGSGKGYKRRRGNKRKKRTRKVKFNSHENEDYNF